MWQKYLDYVTQTRVLILSFLLMNFISFGVFKTLPNLEGLLLDLQFSYDRAEVLDILTMIGAPGRATYGWANLIDTVFPVVYGSFFMGFIARFGPAWQKEKLVIIPLILAGVDIVETLQIGALVRGFPDISEAQAISASVFTSAKHMLLWGTLLLLVSSGVSAGVAAYARRQAK